MDNYTNIAEFLSKSAERYPKNLIFGTKIYGAYRWSTYEDFHAEVLKLRAFMQSSGLKKGDVIAILASNSEAWCATFYAAVGLGAVIVPGYENQHIDDWRFILNDAGVKWVFVTNDAIKASVEGLEIESIERIIVYKSGVEGVETYDDILSQSTDECPIGDVSYDDLACILYTSGTTGLPKGVELTHGNFMEDASSSLLYFPVLSTDCTLSFLPWAHAFGLTAEMLIFVRQGASLALAESPKTISKNLLEANPTVLIGVPKIFNGIHDAIYKQMASSPVLKQQLFERTVSMGKLALQGGSRFERMQHALLDRLVGKKIRAIFGKRMRMSICGGAPLSKEVIEFYDAFGIEILEGYGMTETSPIIALNGCKGRRVGSVGLPIGNIDVEIMPIEGTEGDAGEITIKGPIVMRGYHNNPEATAEVIDEEGRLHTGDVGYLDKDGFLFLIGRVKEQYKLENGKYVVPAALEKQLMLSNYIESAVVVGSGRPYNIALIFPNRENVEQFCQKTGIDVSDYDAVLKNTKVVDFFAKELKRLSEKFRGYERPQKFALIAEELSIDNGMLTPALKIKRNAVCEHLNDKIEALYKTR